MQNFEFGTNFTRIIFGRGVENDVGREMKALGSKVMVVSGGGSVKRSGLYDRVLDLLKAEGMQVVEFAGVQPNPRLRLVNEGIRICRDQGVDCLLAVGGGSTIDSAKGIGMGVMYDGDLWDIYAKGIAPKAMLPLGVVLTIPAAGSETSNNSVLTNDELPQPVKISVGNDVIKPKFAIMNPELTYTLPPYQTAAGIVDIMSHAMERYFSVDENVEFTDRLIEGALTTMIHNGVKAIENPEDYAARAEIMLTGAFTHNNLMSMGRVSDFGSHRIEHELSAMYDLTHGAGLAIIQPAWMKYVYKRNLMRFVQFANRVWDVAVNTFDLEETAMEGILRMEAFFKRIGMPTRLSEANVPEADIDKLVARALEVNGGKVGRAMPLYEDDIREVYKLTI